MPIIGIITGAFNEIARLVCAKYFALVDGFKAAPGDSAGGIVFQGQPS